MIAFAEQYTRDGKIDTAVLGQLKASLSAEHLVKLAAAAAQANWTNRFNNLFGVELP